MIAKRWFEPSIVHRQKRAPRGKNANRASRAGTNWVPIAPNSTQNGCSAAQSERPR